MEHKIWVVGYPHFNAPEDIIRYLSTHCLLLPRCLISDVEEGRCFGHYEIRDG